MNERRDTITEWGDAIEARLLTAAASCVLMVLVGAMIAPIFGWWIKSILYRKYALYDECEQKVKETMKIVWGWLWTIAFVAWSFAIWCNR